jgi:hypothetical protein
VRADAAPVRAAKPSRSPRRRSPPPVDVTPAGRSPHFSISTRCLSETSDRTSRFRIGSSWASSHAPGNVRSAEDLPSFCSMLPLAIKPAIKETFFYATGANFYGLAGSGVQARSSRRSPQTARRERTGVGFRARSRRNGLCTPFVSEQQEPSLLARRALPESLTAGCTRL